MKSDRVVFRFHRKTVECYCTDGSWWCAVQGEIKKRGPFKSNGKAVEAGLTAIEKHENYRRLKQKKSISRIMQKAGR